MTCPWQQLAHGIRLRVHLQPRAAHNRIVGTHGNALKITLTAPPVEGAANAALCRFLATELRIPQSSVSLLSGEKSRDKQLLLHVANSDHVLPILTELAQRVDKKKRDD